MLISRSVVATQGLGAAVVSQASGIPQFNQWFLYVLLVFVVSTLVVEIIYLNKALNIYNAALVTPTYYVFFTSATIVTSAILFRGFKGTGSEIATIVLGFLQICSGVILLQLSKSAKDVPDTQIFTGELDQVKLVAEQTEPESEPKADAIRGTAAIIRQFSVARRNREAEEAWRVHEERVRELRNPEEQAEWDGVRRRITYSGDNSFAGRRRNTLSSHSRFPVPAPIDEDTVADEPVGNRRRSMSVDEAMRRKAYPDLENQLSKPLPDARTSIEGDHDTFLNRVRNLFVTKQPSKTSLVDLNAHTAYSAHEGSTPQISTAELPTVPNRPRGNTTSSFPEHTIYSEKFEPYIHQSAAASSPHVHFRTATDKEVHSPPTLSPTETHVRDWAIKNSGGAYESVPSSDLSVPGSSSMHPPSYGGAKRQFSFQTMLNPLPKGRSEVDLTDSEHSGEPEPRPTSRGHGHGLHMNLRPWKKGNKTEEEMMGLVKGDKAREDHHGGGIRMVSTGDSEAGLDPGKGKGRER